MIQKELKPNSRKLPMLMRLYLTQTREECMISMARKVSSVKPKVKMQEAAISTSTPMTFSSNSSAAEAVAASNASISVVEVDNSSTITSNSKDRSLWKTSSRTQMSSS